MKLRKINLCDFRAFPGPSEYIFDFGEKKHLLIYGENGSGKTSVFKALREFFDNRQNALPFNNHKNLFSDSVTGTAVTCGKVELVFDPQFPGQANETKSWTFQPSGQPDNKPNSDQIVSEIRRRKGLLDYLSLNKVNYAERGQFGQEQRPNLFSLLIEDLLYDLPVTVSGGTVTSLGTLWDNLKSYIASHQSHRGNQLQATLAKIQQFDQAVSASIITIKGECDRLLTSYFGYPVNLKFNYRGVTYRKHRRVGQRDVVAGYLAFDLDFYGQSFAKYEEVLNEAKLSAVALVVYFASLIKGIPQGSSDYPRILVLDDVLIGLDMNNRLPILNLLEKEFADNGWQLILLTHDKVWYDYASHQATNIDWQCYELYADFCHDSAGVKYELPCLRKPGDGAGDYLQRAKAQLALHDDKAAAMYARSAYEYKLKQYCDKRSLNIPFNKNQSAIKSDVFFLAVKKSIESGINSNPPTHVDKLAKLNAAKTACDDIELNRQNVLNPLSHAHVVPITKVEVQAAIDAVSKLISSLEVL